MGLVEEIKEFCKKNLSFTHAYLVPCYLSTLLLTLMCTDVTTVRVHACVV